MSPTLLKNPLRISAAITLMILLVLSASEFIHWHDDEHVDFRVYLTAAQLVREHKGAEIYNAADTGQNPQIRFAPADSLFQRTASSLGIAKVRLYVYPPTLADALVPFTFLSLKQAGNAWLLFNILCIAITAMLVTWMFYDSIFHVACIGFFIGIFCFRANILALEQGQISSVLLLLWTAGIAFYVKGFKRASAAVFALATAIKLTPLLVLLPFLLWREWKWLRWFALSLLALGLVLCLVNGPSSLLDYALHVMPPMSAGYSHIDNLSLSSAIPQLYLGLTGGDFRTPNVPVPTTVVITTKIITTTVLLAGLFYIYKLGRICSILDRAKILSLVALLSLYCSPIAWRSAYGLVFLAALFLWKDAFDRGASNFELALLIVCTLEFSFALDTIFLRLTHGALLSSTALLAPLTGCVLIFYTLRKMQLARITQAAH